MNVDIFNLLFMCGHFEVRAEGGEKVGDERVVQAHVQVGDVRGGDVVVAVEAVARRIRVEAVSRCDVRNLLSKHNFHQINIRVK